VLQLRLVAACSDAAARSTQHAAQISVMHSRQQGAAVGQRLALRLLGPHHRPGVLVRRAQQRAHSKQ
jgi:hypothetical protein